MALVIFLSMFTFEFPFLNCLWSRRFILLPSPLYDKHTSLGCHREWDSAVPQFADFSRVVRTHPHVFSAGRGHREVSTVGMKAITNGWSVSPIRPLRQRVVV